MLETVAVLWAVFGLVIGFWACLSAGCDSFRRDVLSVAKMLLEKGYGEDQILAILSLYFGS